MKLVTGCVVRYPYLWARQAEAGETEGRKDRPAAIAFRVVRPGGDHLLLIPITTSPPTADRWAVEVPDREKPGAGLDPRLRQWIVLDEANADVVKGSFYLSECMVIGQFSPGFFYPLVRQMVARMDKIRKVSRRT